MARRDSPQTGRPAAASSVAATRTRLQRLIERHRDWAIADLDHENIEPVLAATPAKNRRNVFGAITRLLAWAKRGGYITTVATSDLARPPMPPPRTRTPAPEEIRRLLDAADQLVAVGRWAPVQRDAVFVLLLSGQRRGEIASMDWADLDLCRSLWSQPALKNKAKRPHVIPLSARVTALLQARWENAGRPKTGLVLTPLRGGRSVYEDLGDRAKSLRIATGVAFSLHDARRAMTSACAERNVSFEVLDTLLNHAAATSRGGLRSVITARADRADAPGRRGLGWRCVRKRDPNAAAGMKRKRPPPKRTAFQRMCDVGDIVGCVDELMQEGGFPRTAAFAVTADILGRSESAVRKTYDAHKKQYPIGTPDVRVSRSVTGQKQPPVLTFVATGQRIEEDPLLPFERLLGHPLGIALLMEMTEYPSEESCLAKLETGGVRCTRCRGDRVKRKPKNYWWCPACRKQFNPAKVKAGEVHCTHCGGDRVTSCRGHHWWCATCRRQFSSLTGTPMEGTHVPLRLWTAAIFLKLLSGDRIRQRKWPNSLE